ncbi:MAG: SDR family oxidoreductase [Candidatus Bipolaricaulota bacterium]
MTRRRQRVLVVGASSGIGAACAHRLAEVGYSVIGTSRRPGATPSDGHCTALSCSINLPMIPMDVDDEGSVGRGVAAVLAGGRLDAVVFSAGYGVAGPVEETSDSEARALFETNFHGAQRVLRAVLPALRAEGGGTVVLISSIAGRVALPFQGLYSASKFALEGMAEALRMEVRRFGVRVVLVEPGDFRTSFTDRRRYASGMAETSAYREMANRVLAIAEADERAAPTPEAVGRCVERILSRRSPRLRYTVGAPVQRLAAGLKRFLPGALFEFLLRGTYHVDHRTAPSRKETP